jgi:hypothetical protein
MRLPGRVRDSSARKLRTRFLSGSVDLDAFLKENAFHLPKTAAGRYDLQAKVYGVGSIVIDHFWGYLQDQPVRLIMEQMLEPRRSLSFDERLQEFPICLNGVINLFRDRFTTEARASPGAGKEDSPFSMLVCYAALMVQRSRHLRLERTGVAFPSMADLPTLLARMARVAPLLFRRDVGREPNRDELHALLAHPNTLRMFLAIMVNDRKATYPLFRLFESKGKINLNDLRGRFVPDGFTLHRDGDARWISIQPEMLASHRALHEKAARRRLKRDQPPRPALGCPVLYTGKFRNMYDWTLELMERWI